MTMKYRVRVHLRNDADAGLVLYSDGMTKAEAFELCPVVANTPGLQVAALDVINARGYPVEEGVPNRKSRN